jgi:nitrogen-specific signal transduction histidine kinase
MRFIMDAAKMLDNLNTAVVWCDAEFNVIDANPKCKLLFKELLNMENFVGRNMAECHMPETMTKLKSLFQEYREKKKKLDYYTMDVPDGKLTIVNVPFYDGDVFAGVTEFIFESSLA